MDANLCYLITGVVRKQLGLSFIGETRGEDQRFVIGDLQIRGLDREVSLA